MKKTLMTLAAGLALLCMIGPVHAKLTVIGTATYNANEYKLIWDDDNNGNSVIWLDYSNDRADWADQASWAAGLGDELTINLYEGYSITWEDDAWRLPATVDGDWVYGYEGDPDEDGIYTYTRGYNLANSELGHLFYVELDNMGQVDTLGTEQSAYGLTNTADFENLIGETFFSGYWSGTLYGDDQSSAWGVNMYTGAQSISALTYDMSFGLALRSGQVSKNVVVHDDFDDGVLDSAWQISLDKVSSWSWEESGSSLGVSDINGQENTWAYVDLSQSFESLDDFELEFDFSWDHTLEAIQTVYIELYGNDGETLITQAGLYDAWRLTKAQIYIRHTQPSVYLDLEGTANIKITRTEGVLSFFWNDEEIHSEYNEVPVDKLTISFGQYEYYLGEFGPVYVDRVHLTPPLVSVISGQVTLDIAGHEGLSVKNATVTLEGTGFSTTTDDDGYFELYNVPEGTYTILVTADNLVPFSMEITATKDMSAVTATMQGGTVTQDQLEEAVTQAKQAKEAEIDTLEGQIEQAQKGDMDMDGDVDGSDLSTFTGFFSL